MPALLVRGGDSHFTTDADVQRMRALVPSLQVETVAGSGHSVQSDQPRALAALIEEFVLV